jgi:MoaA/NifB/PqqE/SkfB family radical SAM enzyme
MKNYDYLKIAKSLLFLPKEIYYSPLHIQIDVTTYCNLQCKMCYAKKIILPQENNKHLTF